MEFLFASSCGEVKERITSRQWRQGRNCISFSSHCSGARRRIAELMSRSRAGRKILPPTFDPRRNKSHRSWKIITESLSSPPKTGCVNHRIRMAFLFFFLLFIDFMAQRLTRLHGTNTGASPLIQAQGFALFMAWFWYEKLIKLMFLLRTRLLFSSGC